MAEKPLLLVAAAALVDADGRVLICQRPEGKQLAGLWEFPGGKREPGETPVAALARELREELGVTLQHAEPLIALPWNYGGRGLLLDAWRVDAWIGEPRPLEGQALQWQFPTLVDMAILTPADCPVLQALIEARGAPTG